MTITCTKKEYAERKNVSPAAVTKAISRGRVVVLPTGLVDVEASDMLWDRRTDAAQSARANAQKRRSAESPPLGGGHMESAIYDFEAARAKNETHKANISEMDERRRAGELCETAVVVKYLTDVAANFRTALERIADKLADRLAVESDPHYCHALLTAEINQALAQLASDCAACATRIVEDGNGGA